MHLWHRSKASHIARLVLIAFCTSTPQLAKAQTPFDGARDLSRSSLFAPSFGAPHTPNTPGGYILIPLADQSTPFRGRGVTLVGTAPPPNLTSTPRPLLLTRNGVRELTEEELRREGIDSRGNTYFSRHEVLLHERPCNKTLLNTDSVDRRYPKYSYDGGQSFTRDPGAFTGRTDRAHDARVAAANDYRARSRLAASPRGGVEFFETGNSGALGLNAGGFNDGKLNVVTGRYGSVDVVVSRLGGHYGAKAYVMKNGVFGNASAGSNYTLVGVDGETSRFALADPDNFNNASIRGNGSAGVLAEADVTARGEISTDRVVVQGEFDAFAGAKAKGSVPVEVSILGIRFKVVPRGEVSAGAGLGGNAYAGVDSKDMSLKFGCKLKACLGLGAGAGVDVEISVADLVDALESSSGGLSPRLPPGRNFYGFPSRPVYNCHVQASGARFLGPVLYDYYGAYRPKNADQWTHSLVGGWQPPDKNTGGSRVDRLLNNNQGSNVGRLDETTADYQALADWIKSDSQKGQGLRRD